MKYCEGARKSAISFFWISGGIFVINVRKFSNDRYWNFITLRYMIIQDQDT